MPYIKPENREPVIRGEHCPKDAGELNFMVTFMLLRAIEGKYINYKMLVEDLLQLAKEYAADQELKYQRINDVIGAFTGAWMEFVRRKTNRTYDYSMFDVDTAELYDCCGEAVGEALDTFYKVIVGPYEDTKIKENGDVYTDARSS